MKKLSFILLISLNPVLVSAQMKVSAGHYSIPKITELIFVQKSNKLSSEIIRKIESGMILDLYVRLEHDDIYKTEEEKKVRKKLAHIDRAIIKETKRDLDRRKDEIFFNGPLKGLTVTSNIRDIPAVNVRVPDMKTLERLISHPKVIAVIEEGVYKPTAE